MTSFSEKLATARSRLGVALDPAARATRAGSVPGAVLDGPPEGMVENPAATNFGRLATARADVPRYVAPDQVPQGFTPAQVSRGMAGGEIDVRSYAGSRYAAPEAQGRVGQTTLPVGNPNARDAILRASFPQASRSELFSLGAMAYNRPDEFNAATAGKFDPALARSRVGADTAKDALDLASKAQSMRLGGEQAAMTMATQMQGAELSAEEAQRRAAGDQAAASFFANSETPEIADAARRGAPAAMLFDMANLARTRAEDARRATSGTPTETTFAGRPAIVANGNVQFIPQDKPPASSALAKLLAERAQMQAAGNTEAVAIYDQAIQTESTRAIDPLKQEVINKVRENNRSTSRAPNPQPAPAKPAAPAPAAANQQAAARAWLAANPNHPKAAAVRAKLGQ